MKRIASIILILSTFLFVASIQARACWCRKDLEETNTPKKIRKVVRQTLKQSPLVFSATVIERNEKYLKFKVEQIWKGEDQDEILFTSVNYIKPNRSEDRENFIDDCVFEFKVGESYLIYAVKVDGDFYVSKCGRTQILTDANKDIEELEFLTKKRISQ